MKTHTLALACTLLSTATFAQEDGAFLDPKYPTMIHPKKDGNITKLMPANDVKAVISSQTSVKSQAARGTCSIFSATAYIEGLLVKKGLFDNTLDLSEEWLEYTSVRNSSDDGSSGWTNFAAIRDYGMPTEQTFPYIGEDWREAFNPLKDIRCGKLTGPAKTSCLIVHRDPTMLELTDAEIMTKYSDQEFINARNEANYFKAKTIKFKNSYFLINDVSEVKKMLQNETPVVLEVDFYYGAWNHRKADEYGIGINLDHWSKGIVTFPEQGSVDEVESLNHPAGHSILVVGYDDNKIVERTIKMKDGTTKKFTYKGVYYFKNSWGTNSFGSNFQVDGESFPGYGMMVAKYAEEKGQFFKMPLL